MLWQEAGPSSVESGDLIDQQSPPYKPHVGLADCIDRLYISHPIQSQMTATKMQCFQIIGSEEKMGYPKWDCRITAYAKGQMPQLAVCRVILVLDNNEVYIELSF